MLDDKSVANLKHSFKRIFAMPITRSTFREIQNTLITVTNGDKDATNALIESLLVGDVRGSLKGNYEDEIKEFIDEFTISTRTAREVFENGEFINLITSDILNRQNRVAFLTRIRRVDGQELQFITDPEGTVNIVQHFLSRLSELNKNNETRKIVEFYKDKLQGFRDTIDEMI